MKRLFTSNGTRVELGPLLGSGGEGSVFSILGSNSSVAKVYNQKLSPFKQQKLVGMVKECSAALIPISCWPSETLHSSGSGEVIGFIMPRLVGYKPIYKLYSPAHRRVEFPKATWTFLIHSARNLAAALESIHGAGHVVGDLNQGNIYVSSDATVRLIDCDSMQVNLGGSLFPCEVGVAHFTPPELQNKSFGGLRTEDHDNFGLAVLCFHLLFMGRHPFAGRYLGTGDMPIEKAILEGRFVYGKNALSKKMEAPPNTLPLRCASERVASLFELALDETLRIHQKRPCAKEWKSALDWLENDLVACGSCSAHKYPRSHGSCFWCAIEQRANIYFFIIPYDVNAASSSFDIAEIWNRIQQILIPPVLVLPSIKRKVKAQTVPPALRFRAIVRVATKGAVGLFGVGMFYTLNSLGGLALIIFGFFIWRKDPLEAERKQRAEAKRAVKEKWDQLFQQWKADCSDNRFTCKRSELELRKVEYEELGAAYTNDLKRLEKNQFQIQLTVFLKSHFLDKASIKGIGSGLKTVLSSYGIETAFDITYDAVSTVPGIGSKRADELIAWRKAIEQQFVVRRGQGLTQIELAGLQQEYSRKRKMLEKLLTDGVLELKQLSDTIASNRQRLLAQLEDSAARLAQASADLQSVSYPGLRVLSLIMALVVMSLTINMLRISTHTRVKENTSIVIERPEVANSGPPATPTMHPEQLEENNPKTLTNSSEPVPMTELAPTAAQPPGATDKIATGSRPDSEALSDSEPKPTSITEMQLQSDDMQFAPSFDCQKATAGPEQLICSDRELAELDVLLHKAYEKVKKKTTDEEMLVREQREWIQGKRNVCSGKDCIAQVYKKRIAQLQQDAS